jgi:hypothetical protein
VTHPNICGCAEQSKSQPTALLEWAAGEDQLDIKSNLCFPDTVSPVRGMKGNELK